MTTITNDDLMRVLELDRAWQKMRALKEKGYPLYGFTMEQHMELMGSLQDERHDRALQVKCGLDYDAQERRRRNVQVDPNGA